MHEETRGETQRLWGWLIALTVITAVYRLVPYLIGPDRSFVWNLMPVGALALFAGSRLRSYWAYVVPVAAMVLSDLLLVVPLNQIGQVAFSWDRPVVYGCYVLSVAIGRLVGRRELSPLALTGTALLASAQFFVITNFAVWVADAWVGPQELYAPTLAGLGQCFLLAVPFYRMTLLSDVVFTLMFFGLHALGERLLAREEAKVPA